MKIEKENSIISNNKHKNDYNNNYSVSKFKGCYNNMTK